MLSNIRILWLITARSGSKSIPNKNIKPLNNEPLINFRIKSALSISSAEDIWVSTDSEKYALIAKKSGATVPFLRPNSLAADSSSSNDVVLHSMRYANKMGRNYDYIGLLEPTSPFIYFTDLLNAIEKLRNNVEATGIVAVKETRPNTFFIQDNTEYLNYLALRLKEIKKTGRQNFNTQITPSGGFYISKWQTFLESKTFYTENTMPYLVPDECSLEIDEPIDWLWAEFLIKEKIIDVNKIFNL